MKTKVIEFHTIFGLEEELNKMNERVFGLEVENIIVTGNFAFVFYKEK